MFQEDKKYTKKKLQNKNKYKNEKDENQYISYNNRNKKKNNKYNNNLRIINNLTNNLKLNSESSSKSDDENIPKITPLFYYEKYQFSLGDIENYQALSKIGRGRYSEVFEGINIKTSNKVVIKILKEIKLLKYKREIKILNTLKDCPNCVKLLEVVQDPDYKIYCLIYECTNSYDLKRFKFSLSENDIRIYTYKILKCLEYCHSKNIMHRDIKPGNIVVNSLNKELRVVDWGLAEFYIKNFEYNLRVATRYYKPPELLLNYKQYDFRVDLWSLGCLFGEILFQIDYLFKGDDLKDQVFQICNVLGAKVLDEYLEKYKKCSLDKSTHIRIRNLCKKKEWSSFINNNNKFLITDEALDLLNKLLEFDIEKRITAKEALEHPYFNSIKNNL